MIRILIDGSIANSTYDIRFKHDLFLVVYILKLLLASMRLIKNSRLFIDFAFIELIISALYIMYSRKYESCVNLIML